MKAKKYAALMLAMMMAAGTVGCGNVNTTDPNTVVGNKDNNDKAKDNKKDKTSKVEESSTFSDEYLVGVGLNGATYGTVYDGLGGTAIICTNGEVLLFLDDVDEQDIYVETLELTDAQFKNITDVLDRDELYTLDPEEALDASDAPYYTLTLYDKNNEVLKYCGGYYPQNKRFLEMYDVIMKNLPSEIYQIKSDWVEEIKERDLGEPGGEAKYNVRPCRDIDGRYKAFLDGDEKAYFDNTFFLDISDEIAGAFDKKRGYTIYEIMETVIGTSAFEGGGYNQAKPELIDCGMDEEKELLVDLSLPSYKDPVYDMGEYYSNLLVIKEVDGRLETMFYTDSKAYSFGSVNAAGYVEYGGSARFGIGVTGAGFLDADANWHLYYQDTYYLDHADYKRNRGLEDKLDTSSPEWEKVAINEYSFDDDSDPMAVYFLCDDNGAIRDPAAYTDVAVYRKAFEDAGIKAISGGEVGDLLTLRRDEIGLSLDVISGRMAPVPIDQQLKVIEENASLWQVSEKKDGDFCEATDFQDYGYAVFDFDRDGLLEIIKSGWSGTGHYSQNHVYEVTADGSMAELDSSELTAMESQPDLLFKGIMNFSRSGYEAYLVQDVETDGVQDGEAQTYLMSVKGNKVSVVQRREMISYEYDMANWFRDINADNILKSCVEFID